MTCAEARPLLDAYFDSELDLSASLNVERHVSGCAACASDLQNLEQLREELSPATFERIDARELDRLGKSIRRKIAPRAIKPTWVSFPLWGAVAATLIVAVALPLRHTESNLDRELVDSHVRSLMASHLVDVPSSDQHRVKPWFQGKVDFAPDVPDLGEKGYELIGGRLDILDGHPTAALVYRHRGHYVNIWTSRTDAGDSALRFSVVDGYQIARWASAGLSRRVVTDMSRTELQGLLEQFGAK
jgi:anti-sigma factor RsiW